MIDLVEALGLAAGGVDLDAVARRSIDRDRRVRAGSGRANGAVRAST